MPINYKNRDVLILKKLLSFLIAVILLLGMIPTALAAGSASMSGPSTVRAGDTITVSFSAGGGILGGSGSISFDSSVLTLQKYSQKTRTFRPSP